VGLQPLRLIVVSFANRKCSQTDYIDISPCPSVFMFQTHAFFFFVHSTYKIQKSSEYVVSYFITCSFCSLFYYVFSPLFLKEHVPASTPLAYSRVLLDILFTRAELKESILFISKQKLLASTGPQNMNLLFSKLIIFFTDPLHYYYFIFFTLDCVCQRFPECNGKKLT